MTAGNASAHLVKVRQRRIEEVQILQADVARLLWQAGVFATEYAQYALGNGDPPLGVSSRRSASTLRTAFADGSENWAGVAGSGVALGQRQRTEDRLSERDRDLWQVERHIHGLAELQTWRSAQMWLVRDHVRQLLNRARLRANPQDHQAAWQMARLGTVIEPERMVW